MMNNMNKAILKQLETWFCMLVLPGCFILSIFYETTYNKAIISLVFLLLIRILFGGADTIRLNRIDKYIIIAITAAFLVTLYSADLMADQNVVYTHTEELVRIMAAFFVGVYVYQHDRNAFLAGLQIISWIILLSAVISSVQFAINLVGHPEITASVTTLESYLSYQPNMMTSVYRHHIPAGTIFVIGIALPLFREHRRLDAVLKILYFPALVFCYARSAWIACAVLMSILLYFADRRRHHGKLSKLWWIIMLVLVVGMVFVMWVLTRRRGDTFGASNGRIRYWKYLLTVMYRRLPIFSKIFGVGFYNSTVMDQTPVAMPTFPAVDNAYLTILYEQGLVGLIAVGAFLVRAAKSVWRRDERAYYAAAFLAASVSAVFYEIHFWAHVGFLMAVLAAMLFAEQKQS